ncbi:MAG: hypothetical protein K0R31_2046, partial [Clostridiales bacterium]|nr:hypothetical protein [Clostridiales bacterium]
MLGDFIGATVLKVIGSVLEFIFQALIARN